MGNVVDRVRVGREEMDRVQTQIQTDTLSVKLIQEERRTLKELVSNSKAEESFQKQKSRERRILV